MKILGVNGGNGVILYPLRRYLVGNIECRALFKTPKDIQWKLNFGNIPLINNKKDIDIIPECDVIIGAPNCGHSSILSYSRSKKLSNPLEDESFELYIQSIIKYQPRIFLMENLPKSLDLVPLEVWKQKFPNYEFVTHVGSVSKWGNSQYTRIRLILIGVNRNYYSNNLNQVQYHLANVYKIHEPLICKDLYSDLLGGEIPEFGHIREDINSIITMYSGFKISLKEARDIWLKGKASRWIVKDRKFSTAPGVYRNLDEKYPMVARKANRQFNQQGLQLTPRELARIQGIPDSFEIYLNKDNKTYSINKGRTTVTKTPPYEIGKWFYKQLKTIRKNDENWK